MGVGLLFRQLKHIHTGQGDYCSIYPLSVFLPESLPGLSIDVHLPPTSYPKGHRQCLQWSTYCLLQASSDLVTYSSQPGTWPERGASVFQKPNLGSRGPLPGDYL